MSENEKWYSYRAMNRMGIFKFVYNKFLQITKKVANPFSISTHEYIRPLSSFSIHECKLTHLPKMKGGEACSCFLFI